MIGKTLGHYKTVEKISQGGWARSTARGTRADTASRFRATLFPSLRLAENTPIASREQCRCLPARLQFRIEPMP